MIRNTQLKEEIRHEAKLIEQCNVSIPQNNNNKTVI